VAGNPGNPDTAKSITLAAAEEAFRPSSDAIPSIVASSDVMGPGGIGPFQYLQEATLRNIMARDPQDNVRQFLDFQHQHGSADADGEVPMTPPFDLAAAPPRASPHGGLRALPRLAIPGQAVRQSPQPASAHPLSAVPLSAAPPSAVPYNPYAAAVESSPDLTPTAAPYRFGSPFSEVDVPLTAVPLGPVSRDISQSVPPDMNYRSAPSPPQRSQSRASARRPSFHLLQTLDENMATPIAGPRRKPQLSPPSSSRPPVPVLPQQQQQRPLQPPPRFQYPWTSERTSYEKAIAPVPQSATSSNTAVSTVSASSFSSAATKVGSMDDTAVADPAISYAGPMKKRKTRMLRHEWQDHFFTLRGTRLAMHKSSQAVDRTLEYIDIDDYAVACSSLASTSKLNAAFKAMNLMRRSSADKQQHQQGHDDVAAFAFQLIPQDARGGVKLRKRDSSMSAVTGAASVPAAAAVAAAAAGDKPAPPSDAVNGTGKSHHFAVKSRDDRIDWMRELMLAKALKQKGAGFEVSVNGNMI